jgi:hypothetical protein
MQPPRAGVVVADLLMSAEYRDGNGPNGMCATTDRVVPARWRLSFAGGERIVVNVSHDPLADVPSLVTCKGEINQPALRIEPSPYGA